MHARIRMYHAHLRPLAPSCRPSWASPWLHSLCVWRVSLESQSWRGLGASFPTPIAKARQRTACLRAECKAIQETRVQASGPLPTWVLRLECNVEDRSVAGCIIRGQGAGSPVAPHSGAVGINGGVVVAAGPACMVGGGRMGHGGAWLCVCSCGRLAVGDNGTACWLFCVKLHVRGPQQLAAQPHAS